jgi:hypothetical protein
MSSVVVVSKNAALAVGLASADYDVVDLRPNDAAGWIAEVPNARVLVLDIDDLVVALDAVDRARALSSQSLEVVLVSGDRIGSESVRSLRLPGVHVVPLPMTLHNLVDMVAVATARSESSASDSHAGTWEPVDDQPAFEPAPMPAPAPLVAPRGAPVAKPAVEPAAVDAGATRRPGAASQRTSANAPTAPPSADAGATAEPKAGKGTARRARPAPAEVVDSEVAEPTDAGTAARPTRDVDPPAPRRPEVGGRRDARPSPVRPEVDRRILGRPSTAPPPSAPPAPVAEPASGRHVEVTPVPPAVEVVQPARAAPGHRAPKRRRPFGRGHDDDATDAAPPSTVPDDTATRVRRLLSTAANMETLAVVAQELADDLVERMSAAAAAVLVPDGATWRIAGGSALRPLERRLQLTAESWLVQQVVSGKHGLVIEDTDVARQSLSGTPLAHWRHLLAVPIPRVDGIAILARDDETYRAQDLTVATKAVEVYGRRLSEATEARALARLLLEHLDYED